jgi:hypothetical protein
MDTGGLYVLPHIPKDRYIQEYTQEEVGGDVEVDLDLDLEASKRKSLHQSHGIQT